MCLSVRGTDIKRDVAAFLSYSDSCDDMDMEISGLHKAGTSLKILLILSSLSIAKASITHMSPGLEPLLGLMWPSSSVQAIATLSPEPMWLWGGYESTAPAHSQATVSRIRMPFPKGVNIPIPSIVSLSSLAINQSSCTFLGSMKQQFFLIILWKRRKQTA